MSQDLASEKVTILLNPKGEILNDSTRGVDHLSHTVYAKALAQKIKEATPPVTIGVFGRWGCGKSQLLKQIRDLLEQRQKQDDVTRAKSRHHWRKWFACRLVFLLVLILVITFIALIVISPNIFDGKFPTTRQRTSNSTNSTMRHQAGHSHTIRDFSLCILAVFLVVVSVVLCCGNPFKSAGKPHVLCYATFTKLPTKKRELPIAKDSFGKDAEIKADQRISRKKPTNLKFIFVTFNAWEYAGSDTLWAAIVTNLSRAIEKEFGKMSSRLFRLLCIEAMRSGTGAASDKTTLYIELPELSTGSDEKLFKNIAKDYGVVVKWERVKKYPDWWVVQYSTHEEAERFRESMCLKGMNVTYNLSSNLNRSKSSSCQSDESQSFLIGNSAPTGVSNPPNPRSTLFLHFLDHFMRNPKTVCSFPVLFWWIISFFLALAISSVVIVMSGVFNLDIYRHGRAVPVVVQVIAWLPPVLGVFYVVVKLVWSLFHSQRKRIRNALKGTKSCLAEELGFMCKVKDEVKLMTEMVRCAEFAHKREYKIIITIDDLDRVETDKVKSVLDAVSILLSDKHSPFVCLIAVDSRVAVKSVESSMSAEMIRNNVNGYEYLKKIINLPFYLPEVGASAKKNYIYGLISLSDDVRRKRKKKNSHVSDQTEVIMHDGPRTSRDTFSFHGPPNDPCSIPCNGDVVDSFPMVEARHFNRLPMDVNGNPPPHLSSQTRMEEQPTPRVDAGSVLDRGLRNYDVDYSLASSNEFLIRCREFLYSDQTTHNHLDGNPRNIKRIFNVLTLTLWIFNFLEEEQQAEEFLKKFSLEDVDDISIKPQLPNFYQQLNRSKKMAGNLVTWVILTEQWPYRMTYILEVIEEAKARKPELAIIKDVTPLYDVYINIMKEELELVKSKEELGNCLSIDHNHNRFESYLKEIKENSNLNMNVGTVRTLSRITVNLDQCLKQAVHFLRMNINSNADLASSSSSLISTNL